MTTVVRTQHHPCRAAWVLWACVLCQPAAAHDEIDVPAPLIEINQTLNHRIVFAEDALNGGRADHWATPGELLSRGAGDCEDYAIAKYFALLSAGLPAAQLRIAHVMVLMGGTGDVWRSHMVLAYLPSATIPGGELILDNLLDDIRPLAERPDLRVLISFDTVGVWAALDRGEPPREARRIVRWARVLDRMGLDRQTDARGREVALPMNP